MGNGVAEFLTFNNHSVIRVFVICGGGIFHRAIRNAKAFPFIGNFGGPHAEFIERMVEVGGEINRVTKILGIAIEPTATGARAFHPTFNRVLIHNLDELFGRGAGDATSQVNLNPRLF